MPSGWATVPDMSKTSQGVTTVGTTTRRVPARRTGTARWPWASLPVLAPDQGDQLVGGARHVVVDDRVVELRHRRHLDPGGRETPLPLLGGLGAAPDEPPHELLPGGRREEHEARLGHRDAHLARALQ